MAALEKTDGPDREIDMASFCNDKVRFFALSVKAPPYSRDVNAQFLGLDVTASDKVAAVIKDGRRAITLPKARHQEFSAARTAAAQTLARYSIEFPFVPDGAKAVMLHRIDELWQEMDQQFQRFEAAKDKLIADLPTVRDEQRAAWVAASRDVFDARAGLDGDGKAMTFEDFEARYIAAFDRAFPTPDTIRKEYQFDFRAMGAFKKKISLMSRDEFLKDEATQAKLRVLQASEKRLQDDFYEWAGKMAAQTRTKLIEALYPAMEALKGGNSVGKRDIGALQKHLDEIKNANIFGDVKFEDLAGQVQKALDGLKAQTSAPEKVTAEEQLKAAGAAVEAATKNLAFNPLDYRRLELDGDDTHQVFTDAEVCARITEQMKAALEESVKKCAAIGETDAQRADNERRLRITLGIQQAVAAGEIPAHGATAALDAAIQASTIDADDGPRPAICDPEHYPEDKKYVLEIGDGPEPVAVAAEPEAVKDIEV